MSPTEYLANQEKSVESSGVLGVLSNDTLATDQQIFDTLNTRLVLLYAKMNDAFGLNMIDGIDLIEWSTEPFCEQRQRMYARAEHYLKHLKKHNEPEEFDAGKQTQLDTIEGTLQELRLSYTQLRGPPDNADSKQVRDAKKAVWIINPDSFMGSDSEAEVAVMCRRSQRAIGAINVLDLGCHDIFQYQHWLFRMIATFAAAMADSYGKSTYYVIMWGLSLIRQCRTPRCPDCLCQRRLFRSVSHV